MPHAPKQPHEAEMSPSWYAAQLGWKWPDGAGRSWDRLLQLAEDRYYRNRHQPAQPETRAS
jgi:hypothetical protein